MLRCLRFLDRKSGIFELPETKKYKGSMEPVGESG